MKYEFSEYPHGIVHLQSIGKCTLSQVHNRITRDEKLKMLTADLRNCNDKELQNNIKIQKLPYVTFGGVFDIRKDDALKISSNLICLDIDGVVDLEKSKSLLIGNCRNLLLLFISPKGRGLKLIYRCNPKYNFKENYKAYSNYLISIFHFDPTSIDQSCASISKACFLCHDAGAYLNSLVSSGEIGRINFIGDEYFKKHNNTDSQNNSEIEQLNEKNLFEQEQFKYNELTFNYDRPNIIENFKQLCVINIRKHGELKVGGRHNWFFNLALLCNKFGMKRDIAIQYCHILFDNHTSLRDNDNLFNDIGDLNKPFENVYTKYENQFNTWVQNEEDNTPLIPQTVYDSLPFFLRRLTRLFEERERDIFFIGMMTLLSTLFPKVKGRYYRKTYQMNLFAFISAPQASGKGVLNWVRMSGERIHAAFIERYKEDQKAYNEASEEEKKEMVAPIMMKLFLPADNTGAMVVKNIEANKIFGIILDTEADTLTIANKSDHGNFSVLFRKAFEHEPIEYERKTTKEYYVITKPALAILISGTPKQVNGLMNNNIENGFTSRFISYNYNSKSEWKDVFQEGEDYDFIFKSVAIELEQLVKPYLNDYINDSASEIVFDLTNGQKKSLNTWFSEKLKNLNHIYGADIDGSIKRLGVINFRLTMVLTVLRLLDPEVGKDKVLNGKIICTDEDFEIAQAIIETLLHHTVCIFKQLRSKSTNKNHKQTKEIYLEKLPSAFNWDRAKEVANYLSINHKTAEHYLRVWVADGRLLKKAHNDYNKPNS